MIELCKSGSNTWPRHDWKADGACRRCGTKIPPRPKTLHLRNEDVAALLASHPIVIGRLGSGSRQLVAFMDDHGWTVSEDVETIKTALNELQYRILSRDYASDALASLDHIAAAAGRHSDS